MYLRRAPLITLYILNCRLGGDALWINWPSQRSRRAPELIPHKITLRPPLPPPLILFPLFLSKSTALSYRALTITAPQVTPLFLLLPLTSRFLNFHMNPRDFTFFLLQPISLFFSLPPFSPRGGCYCCSLVVQENRSILATRFYTSQAKNSTLSGTIAAANFPVLWYLCRGME